MGNEKLIMAAAIKTLELDFYMGACVDVSIGFREAMYTLYGVELTLVTGELIGQNGVSVPHCWLEYYGKCIDLTSHRQENGIEVDPVILGDLGENRVIIGQPMEPIIHGGLTDLMLELLAGIR